MSDTNTLEKTETKVKVEEPGLYKVIYINDEETSMQFVIETLMTFFDYTAISAEEKTMEIHSEGSAVVGVFPYEIAEQKGVEVTVAARNLGFPLQVKVESA